MFSTQHLIEENEKFKSEVTVLKKFEEKNKQLDLDNRRLSDQIVVYKFYFKFKIFIFD